MLTLFIQEGIEILYLCETDKNEHMCHQVESEGKVSDFLIYCIIISLATLNFL